jgi:hypothetical protein
MNNKISIQHGIIDRYKKNYEKQQRFVVEYNSASSWKRVDGDMIKYCENSCRRGFLCERKRGCSADGAGCVQAKPFVDTIHVEHVTAIRDNPYNLQLLVIAQANRATLLVIRFF